MNLETTAEKIRRKLTTAFAPIHLEIIDESAHHAGHAGNTGTGETHFKVKIISDFFAGQTQLACHRAVYAVLADEMKPDGIHALALHVATEQEVRG